jgi:methionine-S-sulfoxide reductase
MGATTAMATLACGCFWSKEYFLGKIPGVINTRVGYTGGCTPHPTYHQVCTKTTGHAEAVEVTYDPNRLSFKALVRFFFEVHDPTVDRRNKGGQYRSAIFYHTSAQQATAAYLREDLKKRGYAVHTEIEPIDHFWQAEERHQQYCKNRGIHPKSFRKNRWANTSAS